MKKKNNEFPDGFFEFPMKEISWEEATKNVIPFEWPDEVLKHLWKAKIEFSEPTNEDIQKGIIRFNTTFKKE